MVGVHNVHYIQAIKGKRLGEGVVGKRGKPIASDGACMSSQYNNIITPTCYTMGLIH